MPSGSSSAAVTRRRLVHGRTLRPRCLQPSLEESAVARLLGVVVDACVCACAFLLMVSFALSWVLERCARNLVYQKIFSNSRKRDARKSFAQRKQYFLKRRNSICVFRVRQGDGVTQFIGMSRRVGRRRFAAKLLYRHRAQYFRKLRRGNGLVTIGSVGSTLTRGTHGLGSALVRLLTQVTCCFLAWLVNLLLLRRLRWVLLLALPSLMMRFVACVPGLSWP